MNQQANDLLKLSIYVHIYHFDNLDQRDLPVYISHIYLFPGIYLDIPWEQGCIQIYP